MNDLEKHFNRLLLFMRADGLPSAWSRVLFVEDAFINYENPLFCILRKGLIPMEDYVVRFETHLDAGHSWINMNCAGILDDALLIIIELPKYKNSAPRDKVSVNFSGPLSQNPKSKWDVSGRYKIVD